MVGGEEERRYRQTMAGAFMGTVYSLARPRHRVSERVGSLLDHEA